MLVSHRLAHFLSQLLLVASLEETIGDPQKWLDVDEVVLPLVGDRVNPRSLEGRLPGVACKGKDLYLRETYALKVYNGKYRLNGTALR